MAEDGQKRAIKGDISKLPKAIGLTETQRALMRNYFSSPAESQVRVKSDEALIIWYSVLECSMVSQCL